MKKGLMVVLMLMALAEVVLSQEEPSIKFASLECDDLGILSFQADYLWTGYKGGYMYLRSVKINATSDEETTKIDGYWYKFKDKKFLVSEIQLNSPTAYFFSKKGSLKEGEYSIEISYAVSRNNIERFKKQFKKSISCPKPREVVKEVEAVPEEEKKEEPEKEEPKHIPTGEPPLFGEESKNHMIYYVIGLLIVIFVISISLMKKLPKKPSNTKREPSPKKVKTI